MPDSRRMTLRRSKTRHAVDHDVFEKDLRSENKNVCVMFLDIRNFTGFAEKRSPEEVVQYLEVVV